MKRDTESKSPKDARDPRALVPLEYLDFEVSEYSAIKRQSRAQTYIDIAAGRLKSFKRGRRRYIPGTEIIRTAKEDAARAE